MFVFLNLLYGVCEPNLPNYRPFCLFCACIDYFRYSELLCSPHPKMAPPLVDQGFFFCFGQSKVRNADFGVKYRP